MLGTHIPTKIPCISLSKANHKVTLNTKLKNAAVIKKYLLFMIMM